MGKHLKDNKGFTLIEMIVVIVIIAILAAMAIPSMIGYQKDAKRTVAETNARTAYSAACAALAKAEPMPSATGGTPITITGKATATAGEETEFDEKTAVLLGAGFPGSIEVEIANDIITSITWYKDKTADNTYWAKFEPTAATQFTVGAALQ